MARRAIDERQVQLDDQVTRALDEARVARQAVAVAPDLLGANGVRHYFIAFTTPAESRAGRLHGQLGDPPGEQRPPRADPRRRSSDLARHDDEPERTLDAPADYIARYGALNPGSQFRDITLSPDFPSVAQAISSVYPQTVDGLPIDGVLAVDPT